MTQAPNSKPLVRAEEQPTSPTLLTRVDCTATCVGVCVGLIS